MLEGLYGIAAILNAYKDRTDTLGLRSTAGTCNAGAGNGHLRITENECSLGHGSSGFSTDSLLSMSCSTPNPFSYSVPIFRHSPNERRLQASE